MIKPQDKRPDEKVETMLPAAYTEQVKAHAKHLSDSSPEYVVRAIVMEYFDSGRDKESLGAAQPKAGRKADPKPARVNSSVTKSAKAAQTQEAVN